jgi:hypothetical protein
MVWLLNTNRLDAKEKERLIIALKKVERPSLEEKNRQEMKFHLMSRLVARDEFVPFSLSRLAARVKKTAAGILSAEAAASLKVKLFEAISRREELPAPSFYGRSFRVAMSMFLLVVFSATTFLAGKSVVPLAMASDAFLDNVEGNVFVMRDGHIIEGREDFPLSVGDEILTRDASSATVHFLDDSIGRLSANSSLEIKVLYDDPENPLVTQVQLLLKEGRLWGRVVNLIDERAFFSVETGEVTAKVLKKASFDLYTKNDLTKITVFDNAVDLVDHDAAEGTPARTIIAGYQADVSGAGGQNMTVRQMSDADPEVAASKKWVAANIAEDEKYGKSIAADATVDVLNPKLTADVPKPVFADYEFDHEEKYFLDMYGNLISAETMQIRGNHKEGLKYLQSFKKGMGDVASTLPALEQKDAVSADILRQMIKAKIDVQMKDMATFIPGDPLYSVKRAVEEAAIMFARENIDKTWIMVSNVGSRLVEMQELIKIGKMDFARTVLNEYKRGFDQLVLKIGEEDKVALKDKIIELVRQQMQQIKLMTVIAESLTDGPVADFRDEIKSLRDQLMLKLLHSITWMGDEMPLDLLGELRDLYLTYGTKGDETDSVLAVFDSLIGAEGGLNFISPDQANIQPDGKQIIVEGEATPDVKVLNSVSGEQPKN